MEARKFDGSRSSRRALRLLPSGGHVPRGLPGVLAYPASVSNRITRDACGSDYRGLCAKGQNCCAPTLHGIDDCRLITRLIVRKRVG